MPVAIISYTWQPETVPEACGLRMPAARLDCIISRSPGVTPAACTDRNMIICRCLITGLLAPHREAQLAALGVDWSTERAQQEAHWDACFAELLEFRRMHGHCMVRSGIAS